MCRFGAVWFESGCVHIDLRGLRIAQPRSVKRLEPRHEHRFQKKQNTMTKTSLKELREALNALPEEPLENMFITHAMWIEDYDEDIALLYMDEERDLYEEVYEHEAYQTIKKFIKEITEDVKKGQAVKMGLVEEDAYMEDTPQ